MFSKTINEAKRKLENNWLSAIIIQLILSAFRAGLTALQLLGYRLISKHEQVFDIAVFGTDFSSSGLETAALISLILLLDLIIISPLILGKTSFYKKIASGDKGKISNLFSFFGRDYFKSILWRASKFIRFLFFLLLCTLPYSLVVGLSNHLRKTADFVGSTQLDLQLMFCTVVKIPLLILGLLLLFLIMLRYAALPYVIAESRGKNKIKHKTKLSIKAIKGNLLELGSLYMKYVPAFLSSILIFPAFVVFPLFQTEKAILIRDFAKINLAGKAEKSLSENPPTKKEAKNSANALTQKA